MPLPFYHLCVAGTLVSGYKRTRSCGDFYLGNIAPDAVLASEHATLERKFETHLRHRRGEWLSDVLRSFTQVKKSDLFMVGYHMHLMTDIFFRDNWEAAYESAGIPEEEWDARAYRAASYGMYVLLDHEIDRKRYEEWISFARTFTRTDFPYGMTRSDMEAEISFAADLSCFKRAAETADETDLLADFASIYREVIPYLRDIFSVYLK